MRTPPPPPKMTCGFLIQMVFCKKKKLCGLLVLKYSKRSVPEFTHKPISRVLKFLLFVTIFLIKLFQNFLELMLALRGKVFIINFLY